MVLWTRIRTSWLRLRAASGHEREDEMFGAVPVLPVVIPLSAALFVVLIAVLRARRWLTLPRAAVAAALSVYAGGILANTVFPIYLDRPPSEGPWIPPVNFTPVVGYEWQDAVVNMLVFLPLGILVPLLVSRPTWRRVVAVIAGISVAVELAQFITADLAAGGHIADVNDWLCNTAGGAVGFGLLTVLTRLTVAASLIDRFRWHEPYRSEPHPDD
ncbi:VanZ family protein [Curtobacterium sp. MCPF17_031]|uniref:VanZ family protein n=1 Tax=Curtobacterium sp. MCPF17_031 TaxID=2175653 RepID=UPI0021ABF517|nr:VanZ family protein [Curtobacterium sp. MCPF17_031]